MRIVDYRPMFFFTTSLFMRKLNIRVIISLEVISKRNIKQIQIFENKYLLNSLCEKADKHDLEKEDQTKMSDFYF